MTSFGGNSVAGGYSAAYKICYIAINIFTVACNALSNFVSQNIGASKYDRIMKGYVATVIICAIICAVSMLIILPFREFGSAYLFLIKLKETLILLFHQVNCLCYVLYHFLF